ncbi:MAG: DUF2236 domain-containing protein [Chloroflexi bacterium]|nr:DUF2236 domain-containing protein [Chloroflexota bacterium]
MSQVNPLPKTPHGYFSPHDPFWQVNREWLVILSGARAVMLELAHPLVAAGVAYHSNFRRDSLGRLLRTVLMMVDATFGSAETAHQAVGRVNRCHHPVEGVLPAGIGPFSAESSYRAHDPHLKMWVLATLIDSILLVHDHFVRSLTPAEKAAYYHDSQLLGRLLGIPAQVMPATYPDFTAYVEEMVSSDTLTVGDTAREVAGAIFAPPLGPILRTASFAGIGLLPDRLRADFNFPWDERREQRLHWLATQSRRLRALLPTFICVQPASLIGEWRFRQALAYQR